MSKIIDITDKLSFEGNPKIAIKGKEYEVNAEATTVLKIMGLMGDGNEMSPKDVVAMYELMFDAKSRSAIDKLQLQFKDFQTLVFTAITLITGEEAQGE